MWGASRAKELYQRALIKESVERDLDGAIPLYQRAVDEARREPAVAAEARLRMALCFEKLDKPQYAEGLYHQILEHPAKAAAEVTQQARANLRRLEAERRIVERRVVEKRVVEKRIVVIGSSVTARGTWVHAFIPSRVALFAGPSFLVASRGIPATALSIGLRYRLSAADRPMALYIDARGLIPAPHSTVGDQIQAFDSQGDDHASLSLQYQASFGVVGELPHGIQKNIVPEIGTGLSLTASKLRYTSAASVGDPTHRIASPYVEAGLHFFSDRAVSFLVQGRYLSTPFPKSVDIPAPPHSQHFGFPSSQWTVGATLQIKIGHRRWMLK